MKTGIVGSVKLERRMMSLVKRPWKPVKWRGFLHGVALCLGELINIYGLFMVHF